MIPVTLTMKGFLSYRESVSLDFTQFEMACITGQNGAGKSSILDAMTWGLFGKARSNDDDLIHMQESEAEVQLEFDYERQRYLITRTKRKGATKTLLFQIWSENSQEWTNFTEATMTATQAKLERILRMDYETFINASFFLQGKADQFAQQRPADRKNTLAKILELEVWDEYQKKTATLRKQLENRIHTIDTLLAGISAELAKETELIARRQQLLEKMSQLEATAKAQEAVVLQYRQQQEQAGKQKMQVDLLLRNLESAQKRLDDLQASLQRYELEETGLRQLLADEEGIEKTYQEWLADRKILEEFEALARKFDEIRREREAPQFQVAKEEARLRAAIEQLKRRASLADEMERNLEHQEQTLRETEDLEEGMEAECSRYVLLENQYDDLVDCVREIEMDRSRMVREMQILKERIAKLETVETTECPTCGQPLTAEHRSVVIQEMRHQGQTIKEQHDQILPELSAKKAEINSLDAEIKRLHKLEKEQLLKVIRPKLESLRANIDHIRLELAEWRENGLPVLTDYLRLLETGQFAADARQLLAEIDNRLQALGYDVSQHDACRKREKEGRSIQETWQSLGKARATLASVERMIAEQRDQLSGMSTELQASQALYETACEQYEILRNGADGFAEANHQWLEMRNAVSQTSRELGGAEQAVNSLKGYKEQQTLYSQEKQELQARVDQYRQLEDAFSKNGIQALMIEQALPEIQEQANELLSRLSSTGMMVEIKTQSPFRDQKRTDQKETLDIVIRDNAGVRNYEMYSGGEAFRVNFAIRMALSRMLASRSGARLQTLVIDEGFGSQDAEGVQRLVEAINAIQHEFAKILVITHMETLKESFPAQIEVVKTPGGSKFQVMV